MRSTIITCLALGAAVGALAVFVELDAPPGPFPPYECVPTEVGCIPNAEYEVTSTWVPPTAGVQPLLDGPLSGLDDWQVSCPQVDAGTVALLTIDIEDAGHRSEVLYIENAAAPCAQIGGSGVNGATGGAAATRGATVGTGATCMAGPTITVEARNAYCKSRGDAVLVNVIGGKR